ncbi:MAG: GNAT family N-acetyltransferase [Gemmatimonadaceae bacterium]
MPTVLPTHVRRATQADAVRLAELRYEFRATLGTAREDLSAFVARGSAWMSERLIDGSGWWAWVAENDSGIIGTVWINRIEKMPNPVSEAESHAYLTNLYVQAHVRSSGAGTALMEAALAFCVEKKFDAIMLWPTPRSRSLYERHGFAVRDDMLTRRTKGSQFAGYTAAATT